MQPFRNPGFSPGNVQHVNFKVIVKGKRDDEKGIPALNCLSPELTPPLGSHSSVIMSYMAHLDNKVATKCILTVPRRGKTFGEQLVYIYI